MYMPSSTECNTLLAYAKQKKLWTIRNIKERQHALQLGAS